jgi:hypothetical protein
MNEQRYSCTSNRVCAGSPVARFDNLSKADLRLLSEGEAKAVHSTIRGRLSELDVIAMAVSSLMK